MRRGVQNEDAYSIALCDDLPEAASFAMNLVTRHPNLCREVYDHEG
jgi:hypothetical protein